MFGEYFGFSIYSEGMRRNSSRRIIFFFLVFSSPDLLGSLRDHWEYSRPWRVLTTIKACFKLGSEIHSGVTLENGEFVTFGLWFRAVREASLLFKSLSRLKDSGFCHQAHFLLLSLRLPPHTNAKASSTKFLWILSAHSLLPELPKLQIFLQGLRLLQLILSRRTFSFKKIVSFQIDGKVSMTPVCGDSRSPRGVLHESSAGLWCLLPDRSWSREQRP